MIALALGYRPTPPFGGDFTKCETKGILLVFRKFEKTDP